jgi:hypothetical protein
MVEEFDHNSIESTGIMACSHSIPIISNRGLEMKISRRHAAIGGVSLLAGISTSVAAQTERSGSLRGIV